MSRWKATSFRVLQNWMMADGFGLSAALSFYTMFALAPILVVSVLVASHFLGEDGARAGAEKWLEGFVSEQEADALLHLVHIGEWSQTGGWVTTIITGIMFIWGASLTFVRLRVSVNRLLGNTADSVKQAVRSSLLGRVHAIGLTFASGLIMVFGIWSVTVASSLGSTHFFGGTWIASAISRGGSGLLIFVGSLWVIRLLPMRAPSWKNTGIGVVFILLAFELGRILLNIYLEHSALLTAYGAATTLVIFLVWIYYTAQAFLLGVTIIGALDGNTVGVKRK